MRSVRLGQSQSASDNGGNGRLGRCRGGGARVSARRAAGGRLRCREAIALSLGIGAAARNDGGGGRRRREETEAIGGAGSRRRIRGHGNENADRARRRCRNGGGGGRRCRRIGTHNAIGARVTADIDTAGAAIDGNGNNDVAQLIGVGGARISEFGLIAVAANVFGNHLTNLSGGHRGKQACQRRARDRDSELEIDTRLARGSVRHNAG